jgi:hypothetical protein
MARKLIFYCDPEKNEKCNKMMCFANPEWNNPDMKCYLTSNRKYAILDEEGKPKICKKALREIERMRKHQHTLGS